MFRRPVWQCAQRLCTLWGMVVPARKKSRRRLGLEVLETRRVWAVDFTGGVVTYTGDGWDNGITIQADSGLNLLVNGAAPVDADTGQSARLTNTREIVVDGGGGNDTLSVWMFFMPLLPAAECDGTSVCEQKIHFDGGDGNDRISVDGQWMADDAIVFVNDESEVGINLYAFHGDTDADVTFANVEMTHRWYVSGYWGNDLIDARNWPGGLIIQGDMGDNTPEPGTRADDVLIGGLGDDDISAGFGNDRLEGGPGVNWLRGYLGNDLYVVRGEGVDHVYDLAGSNTLDASGAPGVTLDLDRINVPQSVGDGELWLHQPMQNFVGSAEDDVVHVDALSFLRTLDGGEHDAGDTLVVDVGQRPTVLTYTADDAGTIAVEGAALVTFTRFEQVEFENLDAGELTVIGGPARELAAFELLLTAPDGSPITDVAVGETLVVHVLATDRRTNAHGLFAAYVDLTYDAGRLELLDVDHAAAFPHVTFAGRETAGLLDEAGGVAEVTSGNAGPVELLAATFRVTAEGNALFGLDAADQPGFETLLFGRNEPVAEEQMQFDSAELPLVPGVTVQDDTLTGDEDTRLTFGFDAVLGNDAWPIDRPFSVTFAESTELGVSLVLDPATFTWSYDPRDVAALQQLGEGDELLDTFTYELATEHRSATGTVTVAITGVNDVPVVTDIAAEAFGRQPVTIDLFATASDIDDVLAPGQLTIVTPPAHGTVALADDGTATYVAEPGFAGDDAFEFTIGDGRAEAVPGRVTIAVRPLFQNRANPFDVNGDGEVTPLDALEVIYVLNRLGTHEVSSAGYTPPPFVDVNGDDRVAPLDALLVINRLRFPSPAPEGEPARDAVFAEWSGWPLPLSAKRRLWETQENLVIAQEAD